MIIDKVIMSSNNNSLYLEFWPVVSKIWKEKMGIDPILVLVSNEKINICEKYGKVIYFPEIYYKGDKRIPTVTQCSRLFVASRYGNENILLSDIDLVPLSKRYFFESIKSFSSDSFVNYSADAYLNPYAFGYHTFAISYLLSSGNTFKEILDFDGDEEKEIKLWIEKYNNIWGTEEKGIYDKFHLWEGKNNNNLRTKSLSRGFQMSPDPFVIKRICRSNGCQFNEDFLRRGFYIDFHCPRPYDKYKDVIQNIININFGGK